jgi:hypothetical protein
MHVLSVPPGQIARIEATEEGFDPAEFVTWDPTWWYPRNWGRFTGRKRDLAA